MRIKLTYRQIKLSRILRLLKCYKYAVKIITSGIQMKKRWLLLIVFCSFISLGETASQVLEKYVLSSRGEPLWNPIKKEHIPDVLDIHFNCDSQNRLSIALSHPRFPLGVHFSSVIIKTRAKHYPPEGEKESQFIYVAQFSQDNKQFKIHSRRVNEFIKDFEKLSRQAYRNEQNRLKEYDDRIKYCQSLPTEQQQQCFQSSSGYQDVQSAILVEVHFSDPSSQTIYSFFDYQKIKNLKKLSCYK